MIRTKQNKSSKFFLYLAWILAFNAVCSVGTLLILGTKEVKESSKSEIRDELKNDGANLAVDEANRTLSADVVHRYTGNRRMAALLNDVYKRQAYQSHSLQAEFATEYHKKILARLKRSKSKLNTLPLVKKHLYELADHLLYSNQPKEALEHFETLLKAALEESRSESEVAKMHERIGICHLRIGEQSNCIHHHKTESCIFPLQGAGIHQDPSGAAVAIKHFQSALDLHPEQRCYQWLLNIAYMATGNYPNGVPPRWLIPPKCFTSEYDVGRFVDVAPEVGVAAMGLSGGCVVEDFNNDGYIDIVASSSGLRDSIKFFINNADGTFEDRTSEAQLIGLTGGLNLCHGDYNNDGFADVYVIRGAWKAELDPAQPNSLLRNNGDGTFEDVTEEAGMLYFAPGLSAQWADFDNDGWLDLCVGNETREGLEPYPLQLFRNNRDGTFAECSKEVGLSLACFIRGLAWGDFDNDGRQDLYITTWGRGNLLYKNTSLGFVDVTAHAGVNGPGGCFPTWFWDYNNDGWLDIFAAGGPLGSKPGDDTISQLAAYFLSRCGLTEKPEWGNCNALYRNNGDSTFTDETVEAGLAINFMPMGANYGDIDNDGFLDFYIGTGDVDFSNLVPNRMYRNSGGKTFQDVTTSGGFGHLQKGHGIAFADLDNDGDQEIYAVMGGSFSGDTFQNALFLNPGHGNHWISLRLEGQQTNRSAIGARLRIRVATAEGERDLHRVVSSGGSFGASSFRRDIGLGKATGIVFVEIHWPTSDKTQRFHNVEMDRSYKIVEGKAVMKEVLLKRLTLGENGGG